MDISNEIIEVYARKIYGFAFSKTKNYHDAEDLSQEILLQLCDKRIDFSEIENMDAYIYKICSYTYVNYLRKSTRLRDAIENSSELDFLHADTDIEGEYVKRELYDRLRQEIMYLNKTKRTITIMFYYEGKSGEEISKTLGIPASTVRWHIGETKKILKERMEMKAENEIYSPIKLSIGHCGWVNNYDMSGLASDVLMQNICWLCYHNALTIEDIARTLGVASVYLEDKIDKLLYMDYLKPVGSNKYRTTFFIMNEKIATYVAEFEVENVMKVALPVYEMARSILKELRKSNRLVGEFSDEFLIWALLMPTISNSLDLITERVNKKMGLESATPKRADGSEHYVSASTLYRKAIQHNLSIDPLIRKYIKNARGCGVKTRCLKDENENELLSSLQYDINFFGSGWRDFDNMELKQIKRVLEIIDKGEIPNDYDKDAISNLVAKGYCRVENGMPVLLIPYIRASDAPTLIWDHWYFEKELEAHMNIDEIVEACCEHLTELSTLIPDFLDRNEKNHTLKSFGVIGAYTVLYSLYINGYLTAPSDDEAKRLCTLVCGI